MNQWMGPTLFACLLALSGCGGKYRAECQRTYDDCTNVCADSCGSPRAQEAGSEPGQVNTYSPRCKVCVDQCIAQANRCDAREAESVDPDADDALETDTE